MHRLVSRHAWMGQEAQHIASKATHVASTTMDCSTCCTSTANVSMACGMQVGGREFTKPSDRDPPVPVPGAVFSRLLGRRHEITGGAVRSRARACSSLTHLDRVLVTRTALDPRNQPTPQSQRR